MNLKKFADMLNNRIYGEEITKEEALKAKELGFVVVYGYSDDNMAFRGAIDDEVGCFNGGDAHLTTDGLLEYCGYNCKYYKTAKYNVKTIYANWHDTGEYSWTYETEIPHETFDILDEDGSKWCKGIVFDIKNLEKG